MKNLLEELKAYYGPLRFDRIKDDRKFQERRSKIWAEMDAFLEKNPRMPSDLLKARLHEVIAEKFEPVIFRHCPFFFEMGVRPSENWGNPTEHSAGSWLKYRKSALASQREEWMNFKQYHMCLPESPSKIWIGWDVFDVDHHCLGNTKLFELGVNGLIKEIKDRKRTASDASQRDFLDAAARSCRAVLRVAERFAVKAEEMLDAEKDRKVRRNLALIASAARNVPANPPRSFHEGLAFLLFTREAAASLESIGISVIAHLDRLLNPLYSKDIESGAITRREASDMLARWMLHTDVKFHVDDNPWPETSTCIELGGVDADGRQVYSDLTKLIIETHAAHKLLSPKLNCRFSSESPKRYISFISKKIVDGHNNFALLNDDIIIPSCMRCGKTEREARLYVNGGCQETIVEGVEHSAGAYFYFNVARVLNLALSPLPGGMDKFGVYPEPIGEPKDFEDLYRSFIASLKRTVWKGGTWLAAAGKEWRHVNPCPFFSASLDGCVSNARDYAAGGAKYNPAGLAFVGFATTVDSLSAIREAVFKSRWISLRELKAALASDWKGSEALRARMAALPKYGHGNDDVEALAVRFAKDLAATCDGLKNERGGPFQPSLFVYYFNVHFGKHTAATPDGRRDGELLSQGCSPGRVSPPDSIPEIIRAVSSVDLRAFPGNAVLDIQVPLGTSTASSNAMSAVITAFGRMGGATLQPNCVSVETLRDAQNNPRKHPDLIVRISGLSAKFVCLNKDVQDEIISRYTPEWK